MKTNICTSTYSVDTTTGLLSNSRYSPSPNCTERVNCEDIDLLVIHNISLPPGDYSSSSVEDFFLNRLDVTKHSYFKSIANLQVSSHLFIRRDGSVVQFVPFHHRAWHAGVSSFMGRDNCNDFSIGIELEGTDVDPYTSEQYQSLSEVTAALIAAYPKMSQQRIAGHNEIAPDRKTDPGESFYWKQYHATLKNYL